MREFVWLVWKRITILLAVIGDVQGRAVAFVFYSTILMPFAIGARLFTDPLRRRDSTRWLERAPVNHDLDAARRQG